MYHYSITWARRFKYTHKEFHEVAYCEEQRGESAVHYGRIPSSKVSVKKLIRQFQSKYPGATIHVVYDAGEVIKIGRSHADLCAGARR